MEKQLRLSLGLFPPGFRFHPSDEELIVHYLHNKVTSHPLPALVIAEIDLYKFNPWELPKKALFGEDEWYFFSPRERKYPNGVRPNRAAGSGYWKATGTDKPILAFGGSKNIGVKKSLVFYGGRPPKGIKTDWIMKEYRLPDSVIKPSRLKGSMRLDDWVLCRVRHKGSIAAKYEETSVFTNYLPKMETARPHIPDRSSVDHQYEDFQVMVSRLTAQSLVVATETVSSISFQRSNSGTTDPPPNAETSIYNRGNTLKRPSVLEETRDEESLIQPRKKQYVGTSDEDLLSKMLVESGLEQYNQGQYQDYSFNLQRSDSIIDFQALSELTF